MHLIRGYIRGYVCADVRACVYVRVCVCHAWYVCMCVCVYVCVSLNWIYQQWLPLCKGSPTCGLAGTTDEYRPPVHGRAHQ